MNALLPGALDMQILDVLNRYEAQYGKLGAAGDVEAATALPKAIEARDLMARSIENDRRDIATAEAAAALLQKQPTPEAIQNGDVQAARAKVATLRNERKRPGAAQHQAGRDQRGRAHGQRCPLSH
ncbi:hypothetical protein ABE612_06400 [Achromobacter xylosoxidans]|uniref:hypothetical protein n=1 Tax=Alcaligenes xylosoxydans xylosoxydans TaxID=85698 RepID=UPI003208C3E1